MLCQIILIRSYQTLLIRGNDLRTNLTAESFNEKSDERKDTRMVPIRNEKKVIFAAILPSCFLGRSNTYIRDWEISISSFWNDMKNEGFHPQLQAYTFRLQGNHGDLCCNHSMVLAVNLSLTVANQICFRSCNMPCNTPSLTKTLVWPRISPFTGFWFIFDGK